jgi:hypothetical protein
MLTGPPKRGKSTLVWALVQALRRGAARFLGRPLTPGPVVYVSEEGRDTLAGKVEAGSGLRVLDRRGTFPRRPWPEVVASISAEVAKAGAALVVVDTLPWWAGLGAEAEKDAGRMQEALEPLVQLASSGVAVLVVHHDRKGGGEDGEAARGSSAAVATVDCIVNLPRRGASEVASSRRTLLGLSRWGSETPEALVFERQGDGELAFVSEGGRDEARQRAVDAEVLAAVGSGATVNEVAEAIGKSRQTAQRMLAGLAARGSLIRVEGETQRAPHRYFPAAHPSLEQH